MATVALIGTLDTKGREYAYLRDRLLQHQVAVTVIDAGILGAPLCPPDVTREEVARAAGTTLAALAGAGDRGAAVSAMAEGAARIARQLHAAGRLQGVLALGGSGGTALATHAMRALPIGVPKLMVSTMASGDTRPYVGAVDVTMMYSVVDIAGINAISARILDNAAAALAAMAAAADRPPADARVSPRAGAVSAARPVAAAGPPAGPPGVARDDAGAAPSTGGKPLVGATMFGVTTPCVTAARERLEELGYEVLVFHATGTGGQSFEALIRDGYIVAALDVTTTELADELVGGVLSAGPDRLTAAGARGIPQVVSLGALDMVNFGPYETVPPRFAGRRLYKHNATVTLMRTTPEECAELGRILAGKLNAAQGPLTLFIPRAGVSAIDVAGAPFCDPEADAALIGALRAHLDPRVEVRELDTDINDPTFARAMADRVHQLYAAWARGPREGAR